MLNLVELPDRWSLDSDDAEVTRLCLDWAVTLSIGSGRHDVQIRIEGVITLSGEGAAEYQLRPDGDPVELAPLLRIIRRKVTSLVLFKDGTVQLGTGDIAIQVLPDDRFEAWEATGARRRFVATPGGGIAVWST